MLITLNVVPAEPFPPATGVIRLSETPEHPEAPPDVIETICALSLAQMV